MSPCWREPIVVSFFVVLWLGVTVSTSSNGYAFGAKSSTNEEMMEEDERENTNYKTPTYETVVCPKGIDPMFFAELTPELQRLFRTNSSITE